MKQITAYQNELKAREIKGFTLMEMLIVIAIIAVLVAIAIPVFTAQLSNARAQTDAANIRSGYATATATVLTDSDVKDSTYWGLKSDATLNKNGDGTYTCQGNASDLSNEDETIGGQLAYKEDDTSAINWVAGNTIKYAYNSDDGTITISAISSNTSDSQ